MKVRIKFAKEGMMKFIGHLDIMRYFQKAIRRAELPIAYSGGFSPHMILSFAAPLGVGITSLGEYFDMELTKDLPTEEIRSRLDHEMVEGMRVLSARKVADGKASKAMSLVAAADYRITFREGYGFSDGWKEKVPAFFGQESIKIWRKTKRSEKETDIRPWIYRLETQGRGSLDAGFHRKCFQPETGTGDGSTRGVPWRGASAVCFPGTAGRGVCRCGNRRRQRSETAGRTGRRD